MLDLTNTTLLFVETRAHKITARVIEDCIRKADFGKIIVFTDKPELIQVPTIPVMRGSPTTGNPNDPVEVVYPAPYFIPCVDFPNKREAGEFYYARAMGAVTTDYALMLEWDGGIFNPDKWRPEFFDYDYIGAPWTVRPGDPYDVGNGGFTLMSRRLGHFIAEMRSSFPVATDVDVCRKQRVHYEAAGFKWPKADLASLFSWELGRRNPDHFGFHGAFNWPALLSRDELVARATLMLETDYLMSKMPSLIKEARWLLDVLPGIERYSNRYRQHVPSYPDPNHRVGVHTPSPQQRAAMQLAHIQRAGNMAHQIRNRDLKA